MESTNDSTGSQSNTPSQSEKKSFVDSITERLDEFKLNNVLTAEDRKYFREEISKSVEKKFPEYLINFYSKDVKQHIEEFCEESLINKEVTAHIVSCLVDDDGRNGMKPEYIFQGLEDVKNKLNNQGVSEATENQATGNDDTANKEIEKFCKAIAAVEDMINWNHTFSNVINLLGDDYDKRRKKIVENLIYFITTNHKDLSALKPCIQEKKDILSHILPPVSILNEPKNTNNSSFKKRKNIIYRLEISFPVEECKAATQPDDHNIYYVGKAQNGLGDRWWDKDTSHLKDVWKIWAEMHLPTIPTELSSQLVHYALVYAHIMGYQTKLTIVDQVMAGDQARMDARLAKTKEIIKESNTSERDLREVWQTMKPDFARREGVETLAMAEAEKFPPYEFVEWYSAPKTKPRKPENLLDLYEQYWIDSQKSTADKWGFNSLKRTPYLTEDVTEQFYKLAKCSWSASQDTS